MLHTKRYAPSDYTQMPWKNGGGRTTELIREGPSEEFTWRLSLAEIAVDGPFSSFPGMQRIITVIQGAGVYLDLGGSSEALVPFQTLAFDGSCNVNCKLRDGPVQDINLIYSPKHVSPRWEWIGQGQDRDFTTSADTTLIFSSASETSIMSEEFSQIDLPRGHLLEIRNTTDPGNFRLKVAGAQCLVISLTNGGPQPTLKSRHT